MTAHVTTDPACTMFVPPRSWLARRRYDRARGRSCRVCMPPLSDAELLELASSWRDRHIVNALDPQLARERFAAAAAQHPAVWNLDADGGVASLHIYGAIGGFWGDVDAAQIVPAIRQLDVATLEVFINSPGGDVWDGIAIRNALRSSPATVITHVDGLAASAASFIATAGDDVVMGENAQLMIHEAWTIMLGNADEMRETADLLDLISQNIATMYAAKAGGEADDWRALMRAETWYGAQEAVDAGLADRVDTSMTHAAAAAASFDLSMFAHAGRAAAAAPIPAAAMAAPRKETRMNRAQLLAALNAGTITQEQYDTGLAVLDAMAGQPTLAPAIATPGEPVAAEYAAGPQGTVTPAASTRRRPVTLNSLMPELLDAIERNDLGAFVRTVNNAGDDGEGEGDVEPHAAPAGVVLTDDAGHGFTQSDRIGQVWQASPEGRPVISSLGAVRPLTSTKIEGWRWVLPTPAPKPYTGGLLDVPTGQWQTEPVSKTPARWAHANRIDRIYTDLGSADLIASLFAILDRNYEGVSDSSVFAELEAGATPLAGATSVLDAIAKSHLALKRVGAVGSKFWMAEDLFNDFATLKISDLPAWIANATGFVKLDGNISLTNVFDADVNFDLTDGEFLAYDSRSATVFESPKIKLEAQVIPNGGVDIGWFAYGGVLINDARAVLKATGVPVSSGTLATSSSSKSKS